MLLGGLRTLTGLWNLYYKYTDEADKENAREERIRRVYNELRPEAKSFRDQMTVLEEIADEYSKGKWKGSARNQFDIMLDAMKLNPCYKKLDQYCDRLNSEALKAHRRAGNYIPLVAEVKTAIDNWKS